MPTSAFNKFDSFKEAVYEGKHNFQANTLKVALTNVLPVAGNSVLANLTEIAYTFLSSRTLTVASSAQTAGVYKLVINDLILTASGGDVGPFQYVVIYDDTATNDELIGWYSYPAAATIYNGETLTLDFDGTNGVFTHT